LQTQLRPFGVESSSGAETAQCRFSIWADAPKQVDPSPDVRERRRGPRTAVAASPGTIGMVLFLKLTIDSGGPLTSYQRYLMETYAAPALNTADQMVRDDVDYFVDLVNQAEQAHFGQSMAQPDQQGIASLPPCRIKD
jgi:hypothetical protein